MLRYYREEGLSAKWDDACARIQAVLPTVSPELTAQFHYERALFALFALACIIHEARASVTDGA